MVPLPISLGRMVLSDGAILAVGSETSVTSQHVFSIDENEDELIRMSSGGCGLLAKYPLYPSVNSTLPMSCPVTL